MEINKLSIYTIQESDDLFYNIGLLCDKICYSNHQLYLLANNQDLEILDYKLWTFSTSAFVPHIIYEKNTHYNDEFVVILSENESLDSLKIKNNIIMYDVKVLQSYIDKNINIADNIILITKEFEIEGKISSLIYKELSKFQKENSSWVKI